MGVTQIQTTMSSVEVFGGVFAVFYIYNYIIYK